MCVTSGRCEGRCEGGGARRRIYLWPFSYSQSLCSCCLHTTLDVLLCAGRNGLPPTPNIFALWMQLRDGVLYIYLHFYQMKGVVSKGGRQRVK